MKPDVMREFAVDDRFASLLGVSTEAVALTRASEVVDLHIDSFIPARLFGYQLTQSHGGLHDRRRFFGQLDFPRASVGGLKAGMWSITTNPFRTARGRFKTFERNLKKLCAIMEGTQGACRVVTSLSEYRRAREEGAHACMISVQGGNALSAAPPDWNERVGGALLRVTLIHLTNSDLGATSAPTALTRRRAGLTKRGHELVEELNAARVFVDLAHISRKGFWDAVETHDASQPLVVTHTGVDGVKPHWRNLNDEQLRAVAETGGTVGVIFEPGFLSRPGGPRDGQMVIEHMAHIIDTVGEDFVSIGSDFDGAISPPRDLGSAFTYPRLTQYMLDRGWSVPRVQKILGGNALRAFGHLRP